MNRRSFARKALSAASGMALATLTPKSSLDASEAVPEPKKGCPLAGADFGFTEGGDMCNIDYTEIPARKLTPEEREHIDLILAKYGML